MRDQYQDLDAEIAARNAQAAREETAERRLGLQKTAWLVQADSVAVARAYEITAEAADTIIRRILTGRGDHLPREAGSQPGDGYPLVKGPRP